MQRTICRVYSPTSRILHATIFALTPSLVILVLPRGFEMEISRPLGGPRDPLGSPCLPFTPFICTGFPPQTTDYFTIIVDISKGNTGICAEIQDMQFYTSHVLFWVVQCNPFRAHPTEYNTLDNRSLLDCLVD